MAHTLPAVISAAIQGLGGKSGLSDHDVHHVIQKTAEASPPVSDAEKNAVVAELSAFFFMRQDTKPSVWGTYFGPMMTQQGRDGRLYTSPDIAALPADTVSYWRLRSAQNLHPVIKARYADLSWDLARPLGDRPDAQDARTAADAYLASTSQEHGLDLLERMEAAVRALNLALQVRDEGRTTAARNVLMALHREAIDPDLGPGRGLWWTVPTRLLRNDRNGTSVDEAAELVESLEILCQRFADASDPAAFNPHSLQEAAAILIKFYQRTFRRADIVRLHETVAGAFEAAAGLAEPMVRSSFLQTSLNAFMEAGNRVEADRVRVAMQDAIVASRDSLKPVVAETTIPAEDIEKFLKAVVVDDLPQTLANIATRFLFSRDAMENQLRKLAKKSPISFIIPMQLMQDNLISAVVGSLDDDLIGRLVHHSDVDFAINEMWLREALNRAIEKHALTADHFAAWSNRHGLFADMTFVREGFQAWLEEDNSKALHLLVLQVETAFRSIAASLGAPTTKKHSPNANTSVVINLGDMLSNEAIGKAIGPDIGLHFRALYSDPRGINLRNRIAHGTLRASGFGSPMLRNVVHSYLVLGAWKELAAARSRNGDKKPDKPEKPEEEPQ